MASQAESVSSTFDTVKLVFAVGLLVASIAGFYYFASLSVFYRALGVIGMSLLAIGVVATTALGRNLWGFSRNLALKSARWSGLRVRRRFRRP
jgi:preprotein translocase subunit SecE